MVLQPQHCRNNIGLGYSPFDRHYLGNHYCFLFLRLLRCFSSAGSLPDVRRDDCASRSRVAPFGNLWIKSYLHLPIAFRSLTRPSSVREPRNPPWSFGVSSFFEACPEGPAALYALLGFARGEPLNSIASSCCWIPEVTICYLLMFPIVSPSFSPNS